MHLLSTILPSTFFNKSHFKQNLLMCSMLMTPAICFSAQLDQPVNCDESSSMQLEHGQNAVCQIGVENESDQFSFFANAGDNLVLTITKLGGGKYLVADVYDPNNNKLTSFNTNGNELSTYVELIDISITGKYTVNISDKTPGIYRFQVDSQKTAYNEPSLHYGKGYQDSIDFGYDRDYFIFNGAANTSISLSVTKLNGLKYPVVTVYSPSGIALTQFNANGNDGSYAKENINLFQSGQYVLEVHDRNEGLYELNVQCVSGQCPVNDDEAPETLEYKAGMQYCIDNPNTCGINSLSSNNSNGTVSPNLDINIPAISYQSLTGAKNLWVKLQYLGQSDGGDFLWKLNSFGENKQ